MNILEKKVELWVIALLGLLGLLAMIVWGNIAVFADNGGKGLGLVGKGVHRLSTIPDLFKQAENTNAYLQAPDQTRSKGLSGFTYDYAAGTRPDAGFLLLSRFDGDARRAFVDLVDLNAQKVVHTWAPDIDDINNRAVNFRSTEFDLKRDYNMRRALIRHPLPTPDGGILVKDRGPLTKIDACSNIVWINDTAPFHHTSEADDQGVFWIPTVRHPPTIPHVGTDWFLDDAVTSIDQNGKVTFVKSVNQIFLDNGLPHLVYGMREFVRNPVHLNDIQPINADGPYWKKGDLLLSLRNLSTIAIYRPSTNKIIFRKDGPWSMQHDVDMIDDHRFGVFNNNAGKFIDKMGTLGPADVMIYDFTTDTVSSPWKEAMRKLDVQADTESLFTVLPNDELFVEEQNFGRIMRITTSGGVVWQYINRAKGDGLLYRVGWSRYLPPEEGAALVAALSRTTCKKAA